jgi:ribosomal-protein-alanine N-acetyltransferase
MKYWSTAPHADRQVTKDLLDRRIAHWDIAQANFQIDLDGRYIGGAGNFWKNEVGFIISPDHWRKGYVSEAMNAIIPHLWATTDHAELTADADPDNAGSVGILRSLGFHETHRAQNTFCINGVWVHSVYLALPRPDDCLVK